MFTAYFDESYNVRTEKNPDDPLVYTVAACISTVDEWRKFRVRWRAALNQKPKLDFFHMTDFEGRFGEFAKLGKADGLERLERFHSIMRDHVKFSVSISLDKEGFDEVLSQYQIGRTKRVWPDYYLFGVIAAGRVIQGWADREKVDGPIQYIFAHLDKQGPTLDRWFSHALNDPEVRSALRLASTWGKALMKDEPALQAADIVAYEFSKRAVNEYGPKDNRVRKSLQNLRFTYDKVEPLYYDKERIRALMENIVLPFEDATIQD